MQMRLRAFLLLCLPACMPSPQVLAQQLADLEQLANQAGAKHSEACKAAPGRPSPALCAPLLACLHQVQSAGHACKSAIDAGAASDEDMYSTHARVCIESKAPAAELCKAAGIVDTRVSHGR